MKSRLKEGSSSKFKKDLISILLASTVMTTGAIGVLAWDKYQTNQKIEEYSNLPTILTHLRQGRGIEDLTNRYVDSDIYPSKTVRNLVLMKDNPELAKDPNYQGPFKVRVDYKYLEDKNKE